MPMRRFIIPVFVLVTLSLAKGAQAVCNCTCVDGRMQNVCDTTADTQALCLVQSCAPAAPPAPPMSQDLLPPPGQLRRCTPRQVYDPVAQRTVWRTFCQTVTPEPEETPPQSGGP